MEITINLLEAASELADKIVHARFLDDESLIFEQDCEETLIYTNHAQELFNEWYDYYYDFLLNLKTN